MRRWRPVKNQVEEFRQWQEWVEEVAEHTEKDCEEKQGADHRKVH